MIEKTLDKNIKIDYLFDLDTSKRFVDEQKSYNRLWSSSNLV